eukprot:scaffold141780_cov34-Prasinocladus_malaysianus.AAC.1
MAPLNPLASEFYPSWMYECAYDDVDELSEAELEELECVDDWIAMLAEDEVLAEFAANGLDFYDEERL